MQLASQELFGFKSFAKRTRFEFGSGVTIIVGPNGCGKSNVVDSLKWVLGEQSAKSLRGQEMMDVIFNGTATRKPLGFAEATLSFRGCKGIIHPELDEVSITRKLFRSGESEYLINRNPCRLKDIRELFMDTGVGMKAYSIIEQGRITSLLQASGAERRAIFDEAAGISKYKARKKETQRRLERTEQNLAIIDTTLEEVGKRLRSLKIQAGRARRYTEYREELRKYRISQALHKYHGFRAAQVRVSGELVLTQNDKEGMEANLGTREAELALLQENLLDHDEKYRSVSAEAASLEQKITSGQERKTGLESHLTDLGIEEIRLQARLQECLHQREQGQKNLEEAQEQLGIEQTEEASLQERIQETERFRAELSSRLESMARRAQALKAEALENEEAQTSQRARVTAIEEETARLGQERAGVEATLREYRSQFDRAQSEEARIVEQVRELEAEVKELSAALEEASAEQADLQEKYGLLETRENELLERKLVVSSRAEVLQKYRERLEGVGEGAALIVREAARDESPLTGIVGLLADRVRPRSKHVKAVEAVLHRLNDAVVVDDFEKGLDALRLLHERGSGRGCFVPRPASDLAEEGEELGYPGVLGKASDLVEHGEGDRPLVEALLGRTLIVDTLETAVGLKDLLGDRYTFASLAGEVLEPSGILTGGTALRGRMSHASELEELACETLRIKSDQEKVKAERESLGKTLGAVNEKVDSLRFQIYKVRAHEILGLQKDRETHKNRSLELSGQLEALSGDLARIEAGLDTKGRELAGEKEGLDRLFARAEAIKGEARGLEAEQADLEVRRAETEKAFHDLRVEHRGVSERVLYREGEARRFSDTIRELEEEYRDTVVQIEEKGAKRDSLRREVAALEDEILVSIRKHDEARDEADRLSDVCDGLRSDASLKETEVRNIRVRLEDLKQKLQDLQIRENEYRIRIEDAVSHSAEELQVVLTDLYEDFDDEAVDWEENERNLREYKEKIDRLGNVNLDAIQECDEEGSRFEYLSAQKNDLVTAKEQLLAVIRKIDRRSREMFTKTFNDIRLSFRVLFRKLFGGGKADVFLEDESDILDSPVEVMAQPKGKKPSSISLLSGGEKTMTCIALIFAIFKAKPSPFCILDEVDAPLDENNIDQFVGMLNEFVKGSQFIIITHNKKTMMVGDAIFGVTMQEPGVSKKVSLKVEEAHQVVDEDRIPESATARADSEESGAEEESEVNAAPGEQDSPEPASVPEPDDETRDAPAPDSGESPIEEAPEPRLEEPVPVDARSGDGEAEQSV